MGKLSKEEQSRRDGFEYFVRLYRQYGVSKGVRIPELDEEIERRKIIGKPIGMDKQTEKEFTIKTRTETLHIAMVIYLWILHNKLEFGEKRLLRFMDYFWKQCEMINEDWLSYDDIVETMKEETGIDLRFD